MWDINTRWFDVAIIMAIFAVGGVIFGRFEMHKPWWRRVLKQLLFVVGMMAITETLGRIWAYGFLGLVTCAVAVIHAWWLPKHGINGLTAEPYDKYLALVTRSQSGPEHGRDVVVDGHGGTIIPGWRTCVTRRDGPS